MRPGRAGGFAPVPGLASRRECAWELGLSSALLAISASSRSPRRAAAALASQGCWFRSAAHRGALGPHRSWIIDQVRDRMPGARLRLGHRVAAASPRARPALLPEGLLNGMFCMRFSCLTVLLL